MTTKSLKNKIGFQQIWQAVTILTSLYLCVIAFMQYNWYPDKQTSTFNVLIGIQLLATTVLRLSRPKRSGIPYLFILDVFTMILASRCLIGGDFGNTIGAFLISIPGIITMLIFGVDYYLRFFYFGNQERIVAENDTKHS